MMVLMTSTLFHFTTTPAASADTATANATTSRVLINRSIDPCCIGIMGVGAIRVLRSVVADDPTSVPVVATVVMDSCYSGGHRHALRTHAYKGPHLRQSGHRGVPA